MELSRMWHTSRSRCERCNQYQKRGHANRFRIMIDQKPWDTRGQLAYAQYISTIEREPTACFCKRKPPPLLVGEDVTVKFYLYFPYIFTDFYISKISKWKMKSMKTLIASDRYEDISFGIKLNNGNIGHDSDVYTFLYFCSFLVKSFLKQTF